MRNKKYKVINENDEWFNKVGELTGTVTEYLGTEQHHILEFPDGTSRLFVISEIEPFLKVI